MDNEIRIFTIRDIANYLMESWENKKYIKAALWLIKNEKEINLEEGVKNLACEAPNMRYAMGFILYWEKTPQGHKFWSQISRNTRC